ncbi:MAG: amidohydrolase [Acidobacteriota bacterium]|nr:amidohydrolase [Acidobacteriota bacterium]
MRMLSVGLLLCLFHPTSSASTLSPADAVAIDTAVEAITPKVIEWRRHFHQNPELGNREFKTAAKIAEHLKGLGLEVTTGVAHTGVVGLLRGGKPGPVVALRADIDALPVTERTDVPFASKVRTTYNGQEVGVMHACGHDTHTAILMGVAKVLTDMKERIPGTVKFIFQPAEEGPPEGEEGGAELMVREGVLNNPDVEAIFGLHISAGQEVGTIGYRKGGLLASADDYRITVKGKQAHGSRPWSSVDPIVTGAQIINALQTIVSREIPLTQNAAVVTVGSIHGGVRSNIIPEELTMVGTVRALSPDMRLKIHEAIKRKATLIAQSNGAEAIVEIPLTTAYPVTYNDHQLVDEMLPTLQQVAGAANVQIMDALTGAEDFSFYAQKVPGFFFFLGGRPKDVPEEEAAGHHTPDFYIDESGLGLGVRALSRLALDYLQHRADRGTTGE